MCVYVCMCVVCVCVRGYLRMPEKGTEPLELELQLVVSSPVWVFVL